MSDPLAPTLDTIRAALSLPDFDGTAAQQRMIPITRGLSRPPEMSGSPRLGGVLLLLYPRPPDGELTVVLTQRPHYPGVHSGQISFPGGRHEPPETLQATALRETHEEIGVPAESVTLLGELTRVYILPSDFEVHPFVGYHAGGRPSFVPDPREVAALIEVPLRRLLDPATRHEEEWQLRGAAVAVPFFAIDEHKVWGATAMMLSEFVERVRLAGG